MRLVPIKTDDQLDLQSLHRVRERWVKRRTTVINQIRGLLLERGITIRKGRPYRLGHEAPQLLRRISLKLGICDPLYALANSIYAHVTKTATTSNILPPQESTGFLQRIGQPITDSAPNRERNNTIAKPL